MPKVSDEECIARAMLHGAVLIAWFKSRKALARAYCEYYKLLPEEVSDEAAS